MAEWILGCIITLSSIGVITLKKPVHACLSFLLTLLALATLYLGLSAPFIAVMQVLVYAGAILVIFMFVIVLFQDAYLAIEEYQAGSNPLWLACAGIAFIITLTALALPLMKLPYPEGQVPPPYGTVEALGEALYIDFFFPFEAVAVLFLVAIIGAVYIGKKGTQ